MGFLFGREKRQVFPEPIISPFPSGSGNGDYATGSSHRELHVPAVWNCVSLIAGAVAMLPLQTFRMGPDGIPRRVTDPGIVRAPAEGKTQSEFLHEVMVSLLLRGNAYGAIKARDAYERPTQIELLHPDKVQVHVDQATGAISYQIRPNLEPIRAQDMWHVRGMTTPGSKVGLAPITYAAAAIGIDLNSRKFASDFFSAGGIPNGVLESDQEITQEQAQLIKDRWKVATQNREIAVMGVGAKYAQVGVKPEESQFLATQKDNVAQIARYFSLDPTMIGGPSGTGMTYNNVEQKALQFLTYTVAPWLKRIEDAVFPLLSQPTYVMFDVESLLRTDAETRAKVDNQRLAGRIVAPSEVRFKLNLPPMTEEQLIEANMVPLTMSPVGGVMKLPGLKDPAGPEAPIPADEQSGLESHV